METETTGYTLADAVMEWMTKHGVEYSAQFVPFSKSRNAKTIRDCKTSELSLNWRVTFTHAGRAFSTDYMQGIGYLPKHLQYYGNPTPDQRADIVEAVEKGRVSQRLGSTFCKPVTPPSARDVLECLALDAGVEDCRDFEDWASEYGYDADSRAAEKLYDACRRIAQEMRAVLGSAALAELRAIDWNV